MVHLRSLLLFAGSALARSGFHNIKHVVFFGDSYTDQSRAHSISNGTYPGRYYQEIYPPADVSATGGFQWPYYFGLYTGLPFENYAVGGAVCSQKLTPFIQVPAASEGQLAWFVQDHVLANSTPHHPAKLDIPGGETLGVIWIGTNDIGIHSLLAPNGSYNPYWPNVPPFTAAIPPLAPGDDNATTLLDLADCQLDLFKGMYRNYGVKNFLVLSMIPLQLTRLYAPLDSGTIYWPDTHDGASWNRQVFQMVNAINSFLKAGVKMMQAEFGHSGTIEYFDTYKFFEELYLHPTKYYNGSIPANVTGHCHQCPNASDWHYCDM